jgi:ribose 5-phosphate isomerase B
MKIAIAADHAGCELKKELAAELRSWGHEVADLGVQDASVPSDYPDSAEAVGAAVTANPDQVGKAERGVIVCGSGVGVCVAANKIPGVRAGVCHDTYSAHQGVEHDDMNVLCLGARIVGPSLAKELLRAFIDARFSKEARHVRRLEKVLAIERRGLKVS